MSPRFIHVVPCDKISLFFKTSWYSTVWTDTFSGSVGLSVGICVASTSWLCKQSYCEHGVTNISCRSCFSDKYLEMKLLDHMVILFEIFWGSSIPFYTTAIQFYIRTWLYQPIFDKSYKLLYFVPLHKLVIDWNANYFWSINLQGQKKFVIHIYGHAAPGKGCLILEM